MMATYNFNHDFWKLDKDMSNKLKEEESRSMFFQSQNDLDMFHSLMNDNSKVSATFEKTNSSANIG